MNGPGPASLAPDGTLPPATTSWSTGLVAFTASPALALGAVGLGIGSLVVATCGVAGRIAPGIAWPVALVAALLSALAFRLQARVDPHADPEDRPGSVAASLPVGLPHAPGAGADPLGTWWRSRTGHAVVEEEGIRLRWREIHHGLTILFLINGVRMPGLGGTVEIVRLGMSYGLLVLYLALLARRHERFVPWSCLAEATAVGPRIHLFPRRDEPVMIDAPSRSRGRILAALAGRIPVRDLPGRDGARGDRPVAPPRAPAPPKAPPRDAADPRTGKSLDRALEDLRRM